MVTRRTFLKTISLLTLGSQVYPLGALGLNGTGIGLALYTVRNDLNQDLTGTLEKVARIGYSYLEAASYSEGLFYGLKPSKFRSIVENLGMQMISTHTGGIHDENVEEAAQAALDAGMKYLVMPSLPGEYRETADGIKMAAENFNRWGSVCNSMGIKFGYHNHAFEFEKVDDIIPYDFFLEHTDSELVTFQTDLYWIVKAGSDPLEYFKRFPGRFELWHAKDMEGSEEQAYTEVGQGVIDFKTLFEAKFTSGMKFFLVELDQFKNHPPFESIRISYEFLKGIT